MAEVKWIKITTDIFSDEKILLIEQMPDADTMIVIWFKLLCLAGRDNNNGIFLMNNKVPYTEEMLATLFRRPINTVRLAIATFEAFGMIEIEDDIIMLTNWEKHQNTDGLEKIREQTRERVAKHREKKRLMLGNVTSNVTVTQCNATEGDIEEEKEIEEERDIRGKRVDYQKIVDMFHTTCPSFPSVKVLSDARKKAIRARLMNFSVEDFQEVFEKAEASEFLKGNNNRNWIANFDWIIKDANMAKILDGNYDNKEGSKKKADDFIDMWRNA